MKAKYGHIEDLVLRKKMTNRNRQLKCRYGITLEDYNEMYKKQKGLCKICNKSKRLVVEHCHKSGKVRGLACDRCNQFLGYLEDVTIEFMDRIHTYLQFDGNINTYYKLYGVEKNDSEN